MKITINILVSILFFATSFTAVNAADDLTKRARKVKNYTTLVPSSTANTSVELAIATEDLVMNLEKRDNALLRIKGVKDLLNANENINTIQVAAYDVTNGSREFITTESISLGSNREKRVLLPVDLGVFITSSRKIEFDLYDALRNLIGTYPVTIEAININTQTAGGNDPNRNFTCDISDIGACIESYLVNNIDIIAKPRRQSSASIQKNETTDRLEINLPFARKFKKFRGNRRRIKVNTNDTGSDTVLASFGETLSISRIRLGPDVVDFANFRYDTANNNFVLSSGVNGNDLTDNFYFNDAGKLGIGVESPQAYLSIRGGTTTMPQIMLEQGSLTTTPLDGALEFDGNELYFTKNGVRNPIGTGATGAQGPQGATGATGPQGPKGDKGDTGNITNGGIVNGPIVFTNNGSFHYPNGGQDGHVWTSDANGTASWQEPNKNVTTPVAVSQAMDIDGVNTIDVTGLNFVPLTDSNTSTIDTLITLTGGVIGQRVSLQLKDNSLKFDVNTAGTNRIFWGRGTSAGIRTQVQSEIFTFLFDGTHWFLVDRYTL